MAKAEREKLRHKMAHRFEKARRQELPVGGQTHPSPSESKHQGTLHYVADSARLAGLMASVAIAQSFSGGKANPLGICFGIAAACFFAYSFIHGLAVRKNITGLPIYAMTSVVIFVLAVYGWWLNEPPLLNLVFKNPSGVFSSKNSQTNVITIGYFREFMVRRTMTHFGLYLSNLGFVLPPRTAPFGVGPQYSQDLFLSSGGETSNFTLSERGITDRREIVWAYSSEILYPLIVFDAPTPPPPRTLQQAAVAPVYSAYFACSYLGNIDWVKNPVKRDPFFRSFVGAPLNAITESG
jgi:hypothetical protein